MQNRMTHIAVQYWVLLFSVLLFTPGAVLFGQRGGGGGGNASGINMDAPLSPTVMLQTPHVYSFDHDMKQFEKAITLTDAQRSQILELVKVRNQLTNDLIKEHKDGAKIVAANKKKGSDAPEIQAIPLIQAYLASGAAGPGGGPEGRDRRPDGQGAPRQDKDKRPEGQGGGRPPEPLTPERLLANAARLKLFVIRNQTIMKIFSVLSEDQQKGYREWMLKHADDQLKLENNDFLFVDVSNLTNSAGNDSGSSPGGGRGGGGRM